MSLLIVCYKNEKLIKGIAEIPIAHLGDAYDKIKDGPDTMYHIVKKMVDCACLPGIKGKNPKKFTSIKYQTIVINNTIINKNLHNDLIASKYSDTYFQLMWLTGDIDSASVNETYTDMMALYALKFRLRPKVAKYGLIYLLHYCDFNDEKLKHHAYNILMIYGMSYERFFRNVSPEIQTVVLDAIKNYKAAISNELSF